MASIEIRARASGCHINIYVDGKKNLADAAQEAVRLLTACLQGAPNDKAQIGETDEPA